VVLLEALVNTLQLLPPSPDASRGASAATLKLLSHPRDRSLPRVHGAVVGGERVHGPGEMRRVCLEQLHPVAPQPVLA